MRLRLTLLLFTLLLFALSLYFVGFAIRPSSNTKQIINTSLTAEVTKIPDDNSWDLPTLPSGYKWESKRLNKEQAIDYRMFWQSTTGQSMGDINYPLTLYSVEMTYSDSKDANYSGFAKGFADEMDKKGWTFDTNYGDKRIMGPAADGVFGSIYGLVKRYDNIIRSVGYSYNMQPASWDGPDSDVVCPCKVHLEVFIGDEVDLTKI